jgi:hypothetical protein
MGTGANQLMDFIDPLFSKSSGSLPNGNRPRDHRTGGFCFFYSLYIESPTYLQHILLSDRFDLTHT